LPSDRTKGKSRDQKGKKEGTSEVAVSEGGRSLEGKEKEEKLLGRRRRAYQCPWGLPIRWKRVARSYGPIQDEATYAERKRWENKYGIAPSRQKEILVGRKGGRGEGDRLMPPGRLAKAGKESQLREKHLVVAV